MTEPEFLARLGAALAAELGRDVEMHDFAERYFATCTPNDADDRAACARCATAGYRMALLTNNVREWEPRWRAMLADRRALRARRRRGVRRACASPTREIYELTLERLGVPAEACLFVDDIEHQLRRRPRRWA